MRILHIVPSLSPITGGPAKSVPAMCRALAKAGHEVTLFSTRWLGEAWVPTQGYTLRYFDADSFWLWPALPTSRDLLRAVEDALPRYDLVHTHSLWNPIATLVNRLARRRRIAYCISPRGMLDPVVFKHGSWRKIPWALLWERRNVEGANLVHFTAVAELDKAQKCGWHFRETVVVPNFIDVDGLREGVPGAALEAMYPELSGREIVLYVGRLSWVKNLDKLVAALPIIVQKRPKATLVLAGPDQESYRTTLEQVARRAGVGQHVIFTGLLDDHLLKAAYARAQVVTLVSKRENFGLAAAEALASGVPVVLSDGVDIGKNWADGGPVVRAEAEPAAIARAVIKMLIRAERNGHPDQEALALAAKEWGSPLVDTLCEAYQHVIDWQRR